MPQAGVGCSSGSRHPRKGGYGLSRPGWEFRVQDGCVVVLVFGLQACFWASGWFGVQDCRSLALTGRV